MQENLAADQVKSRSVFGVLTVTLRTGLLQLITFAATFLLTLFLTPEEFGVFFIVSAIVNFLVYFSDIGLAAALIQKKQAPTEEDYATTFTIQQALVVGLSLLALLVSPLIARFYHLSPAGLWLFRGLVIAFFLSSLKTIPSVILERDLRFDKIIIPQIVENICFYFTAVFLAWQGYGVTSFTVAVVVRGVSGLIVIYLLAPWRPRFRLNFSAAKHLLSFGVPFQLNSFLGLIKDDFLTVFLGKVLPLAQVGYLGWAQRWSLFPLRLLMDSVNKVTFPAYSRLQDQVESLKKAIEKSLFFISLLIFPLIVGLAATAPAFVRLIPRYQKWQPALLVLALYSINSLWSSLSTTITNAFAGMGRIKLNLKLMVFWTTLTWILTPLLVNRFGYIGAALAAALVACTSFIPFLLVYRLCRVRVLPQIYVSLLSALAMGVIAFNLAEKTKSLGELFLIILFSAIIYIMSNILTQPQKLFAEIAAIGKIILKK